jgi:hypothetical protein
VKPLKGEAKTAGQEQRGCFCQRESRALSFRHLSVRKLAACNLARCGINLIGLDLRMRDSTHSSGLAITISFRCGVISFTTATVLSSHVIVTPRTPGRQRRGIQIRLAQSAKADKGPCRPRRRASPCRLVSSGSSRSSRRMDRPSAVPGPEPPIRSCPCESRRASSRPAPALARAGSACRSCAGDRQTARRTASTSRASAPAGTRTVTTPITSRWRESEHLVMVRHSPGSRRLTLGADKAYDVHKFVDDLRDLNVTPHRPAVDPFLHRA